jgi:hypothetical protein
MRGMTEIVGPEPLRTGGLLWIEVGHNPLRRERHCP